MLSSYSLSDHSPKRLRPATSALISTPVGALLLAATDAGLALLHFAPDGHLKTQLEKAHLTASASAGSDHLRSAQEQILAYFAGRLQAFELRLDLSSGTAFEQRVWRETCGIGYGRVASYGELAERIGSPLASRAVGGALGSNPVAIVVPCHRVLAKGHRLGGFSGGLDIKRALLSHEGFLLRELTPA